MFGCTVDGRNKLTSSCGMRGVRHDKGIISERNEIQPKFKAIIKIGNFKFEGENYDTNRRIVLSIGPFYLTLISTR